MLFLVIYIWRGIGKNAEFIAIITDSVKAFPGNVFYIPIENSLDKGLEKAEEEAKKEARKRGIDHVAYLDD